MGFAVVPRMIHGGNLRELATLAGLNPDDILDFSANLNPLGPPEWLRRVVDRHVSALSHYPDPQCRELTLAVAARYGVAADTVVCGNGVSDILSILPRVAGHGRAVVVEPGYGEYARACQLAGVVVERLELDPAGGFAMDWPALERRLAAGPALVFLGYPGNPTGALLDTTVLRAMAARHQAATFVVDESFADFALSDPQGPQRLTASRPANVVTLLSLTKILAVAGLRLGLALAEPPLAEALRRQLPPWSVNTLAQAVGARGLGDAQYLERSRELVAQWRQELHAGLTALPGLRVFPGAANFLLCQLATPTGQSLFRHCLAAGVAIRRCDNFHGLDDRFFRVAVRQPEENLRLVAAVAGFLNHGRGVRRACPPRRHTPAIMVQGASSNAGKSVLVAALCRILLQEGLSPLPFKAQNMSLNSAVTADGRELGRAQATQAQACRHQPDARMNPVLLKPTGVTGSQVLVLGRPVGHMTVKEYIAAKAELWRTVTTAYDELAGQAGVMVLEGAGSPAEVNLKAHDIVNMRMAAHARAKVLLVADIDRGGAYAALLGTMDCLEERERQLVAGLLLNKFRGDASLLAPAHRWLEEATGKPMLGVVPHLPHLGLPEEDSVSFKGRELREYAAHGAELDVVVLDLPHISNFTDFDALAGEPDVGLRLVRSGSELGRPDAILLPGSRNTPEDLAFLWRSGLAQAVRALAGSVPLVGICGGYQMLGMEVTDPHGLESTPGSHHRGLELLPLATTLAQDKTLTQVRGRHLPSGMALHGYEIHHGTTAPMDGSLAVVIHDEQGRPVGWGDPAREIWGSYLHGVFDADAFRALFLDGLRRTKGLPSLAAPRPVYDIEPALDKLAEAVRASIDLPCILKLLGR